MISDNELQRLYEAMIQRILTDEEVAQATEAGYRLVGCKYKLSLITAQEQQAILLDLWWQQMRFSTLVVNE